MNTKTNKTEIENLLKVVREKITDFSLIEYLKTITQCDPKELDEHDIDLLRTVTLFAPPCSVGDVVYRRYYKHCSKCRTLRYGSIMLVVKKIYLDENNVWIIEATRPGDDEWTCCAPAEKFYLSQESVNQATQETICLDECTI